MCYKSDKLPPAKSTKPNQLNISQKFDIRNGKAKESCCARSLLGKHVYLQYSCTLQLLSLSSFILPRTSLNLKDAPFFLLFNAWYYCVLLSCSMELKNSSTSFVRATELLLYVASNSSLLNNNTFSCIHVNVLSMNGWILHW